MAVIFWVEDQSHWIRKFTPVLESENFDDQPNSLAIYNFAEAARQKIALTDRDSPPDVALLDARMNGNDQAGFSVSNALRKKWPRLPIIYLSEHSGTEIEREALEQFSAADFIAKHQHNVEQVLCWRIKAVLRQTSIDTDLSGTVNMVNSGDLSIDLNTWNVYWKGKRLMNPSNTKRPLAPTPRNAAMASHSSCLLLSLAAKFSVANSAASCRSEACGTNVYKSHTTKASVGKYT